MAEKRLIDANGLWSDIMMIPHNGDMISSEEVEQAIMDSPTVDAVEVVRCKDCKCWDSETGFCDKHSRFYHGGLDWDMFNDDDFCSQGERRTDG